jgi:hypothetical protein
MLVKLGSRLLVLAAVILMTSGGGDDGAVQAQGTVWEAVADRPGATTRIDGPYALARLNKAAYDATVAQSAITITLPLSDGSFGRFMARESSILVPELAAAFPTFRTYVAQGIDDPSATARLGWTDLGFHAIVLAASGTTYVDPSSPASDLYIAVQKSSLVRPSNPFICSFNNDDALSANRALNAFPITNGTSLRTYRLALAATGEYTIAAGGTKAAALSRMVTSMNRVNGIYERDLAVTMTLATGTGGDPTALIYTSAADPYTNDDGGAMLDENQANIDTVIGTANYDIGHVFSTGGGGVAALRSPCAASVKAQGVTGLDNPVGDAFDVDYVSHEIGHQFGGNHTFNGLSGNCGTRSSSNAYEVGSGSTIQAYAGICGAENLQRNSDDYFTVESLNEMTAFITNASTGGSCGSASATGNTVPTVSAGSSYTIPVSTPFTLTASGSDSNGDTLTYNWEQYNLGTSSNSVLSASTDNGTRPIMRSYPSTTSSARTIPKLTYILNNANTPPSTYTCSGSTCLTGEILPTTSRTMTFHVTARDNRSGGGGIATSSMTVTSSSGAGPFVVTAPNTAVTLTGNSTTNVTWNVANTTASPVSAANVRILLSTDSGATFPTVVSASTANDGSETVTVPNTATTTARLKIEAVGNIFFDVSNTNFTIVAGSNNAPGAPTGVAGTGGNAQVALSWTAPESNGGSAITGYQVQVATSSGGTYSNAAGCPTNSTTSACTVTGLTNGTPYFFKVAAINAVGTGDYSSASSGVTAMTVPGAPTGVAGTPGNTEVVVSWTAPGSNGGSAMTGYQVQVATSAGGTYSNAAGCPTSSTATSCTSTGLANGTQYFFKAAAINAVGTGVYSSASSGVTPAPTPGSFTDTPLVAGVTPIRAAHILELRSRIDALRALHGSLGQYSYTDTITSATSVKAVHILELRQALLEVYQQMGRTPPTYTTTPAVGGSMVVADIQSLRAAVLAIE